MIRFLGVLTCLHVTFNMLAFGSCSSTYIDDNSSLKRHAPTASTLTITKDVGMMQVRGQHLRIIYVLRNESPSEALFDLTIRDDSFAASPMTPQTLFTIPANAAAHCPGCKYISASSSTGRGIGIEIRIPVLHAGERLVRSIAVIPQSSTEFFVDRAARVSFSDSAGRAQRPVFSAAPLPQSEGEDEGPTSVRIIKIFGSQEDQRRHLQTLASSKQLLSSSYSADENASSPEDPDYNQDSTDAEVEEEEAAWWHGIPIFQEWRQRLVIGLWAALSSALPMYWYEWMMECVANGTLDDKDNNSAGSGAGAGNSKAKKTSKGNSCESGNGKQLAAPSTSKKKHRRN